MITNQGDFIDAARMIAVKTDIFTALGKDFYQVQDVAGLKLTSIMKISASEIKTKHDEEAKKLALS